MRKIQNYAEKYVISIQMLKFLWLYVFIRIENIPHFALYVT